MSERRLSVADKGWAWVVLAGSFGAHMISGCFLYAIGVIHNAFLERFHEDVGKTSWASSLYLGMVCLTGVPASALINLYSCRVTMFIGAFLMTAGFVICTVVQTLDLVILFFGGLGGMTYLAGVVIIGYNFNHKRNVANGIAASGCGVGTFILAPVVEAAREEYGNRAFFFIIAGIAFHQALFGCLFFPSKLESGQKRNRNPNLETQNRYVFLKHILHSFVILKHVSFLCICLSMLFACVGIFLVYVHFPRYVIEMGSSPMRASFLMSVSGVCNCFSRALAGMAADNECIDELVIYIGTFGLLGLSTLLFPLYALTYGGQLVYAVFLGLYSGCCYSIINTLIINLVGLEELATGYGTCMFFAGVGTLIGPPAAGGIIDYGGSYEQSFLLAGCCIILAAGLGMAVAYFKRTKTDELIGTCTEDLEIPTVSRTITTRINEKTLTERIRCSNHTSAELRSTYV